MVSWRIPGRLVAGQLARPHGLLAGSTLDRLETNNHRLVTTAIAHARPRPGDAAADVGFGNANGIAELAELVGPSGHVYGVDPSAAALRRARRRLRPLLRAGQVSVCRGTFEELPLPDSSLDVLITCNTVYFCPDLEPVRAELARVARPGARFVVGIADPQRMREVGMPLHTFTLREPEVIAESLATPGRLDFVGISPIPDQPMGFQYLRFQAPDSETTTR